MYSPVQQRPSGAIDLKRQSTLAAYRMAVLSARADSTTLAAADPSVTQAACDGCTPYFAGKGLATPLQRGNRSSSDSRNVHTNNPLQVAACLDLVTVQVQENVC